MVLIKLDHFIAQRFYLELLWLIFVIIIGMEVTAWDIRYSRQLLQAAPSYNPILKVIKLLS